MDHTDSNLPSVTINLDETCNIAISHKSSVKSYATGVFQESTIGMVSSILTTHSKYRRFFKLLLSSLCIAGFIYHCIAFLNHVFEYPEVMDFSLDRSETYHWPAYTYCNSNPVNRSLFCSMKPEHCVEASEEFCKKFPSYCESNRTLLPKERYYNMLPPDFEVDWILKYGGIPNILNVDESFLGENYIEAAEIFGPYVRSLGSHWTARPCYSLHSRVESYQQPLQKTRTDKTFADEVIRFYLDETEMINLDSKPGVYFVVHSPFEAENPLKKGIFLKGGKTYELYVEMQEEHLLKAPFESNCMDYDEVWVKNNRTGPRTKKMCREKCHLEKHMFDFQCTTPFREYPHKGRICGASNPRVNRNGSFDIDKCFENCRDECRSFKYTTQVSVQDYVHYVKFKEQHRHIEVEIYLSNSEVKVLRHSPKYETVDVISSIGGFMGCWIGVALLDILDIFGSIFTVIKYTFKKRL